MKGIGLLHNDVTNHSLLVGHIFGYAPNSFMLPRHTYEQRVSLGCLSTLERALPFFENVCFSEHVAVKTAGLDYSLCLALGRVSRRKPTTYSPDERETMCVCANKPKRIFRCTWNILRRVCYRLAETVMG